MSAPRQVLPGTCYLITRRCAQRQFFLRPCADTNGLFLYVLAVAARRYHIQLHAFCVLSNHLHIVLTDPDACLPAFEQYLDSLVARALNTRLARRESLWDPAGYSAVDLSSPVDIVDKAAYALANPVAAGLVQSGREWPGLWSAPEQIGAAAIPARRPNFFFRKKGSMPETAELELTVPDGFGSAAEFRERLTAALATLEQNAAEARASEKRGFMGAARVLAQKPTGHPTSNEPLRTLNPRIAGRDKWKRIEALSRLAEFLRSYRAALGELRKGAQDVLFPHGTYWLRVAYGVRCAGSG